MAPRLKVFTWSDGFHAFTTAVSSRPKALEAWGSKQDLFATGLARELSDGPDYEAALASPGAVIQRGLAIDVGKIATRPVNKPSERSKAGAAKRAKLKAALEDLDIRRQEALKALNQRLEGLKRERTSLENDYGGRRKKLLDDLKKAGA